MAKRQVIWSITAHQDRLKILEYWTNRNKNKDYSRKLYTLFNSAIELLSIRPNIGRPTDEKGVRLKVVRDYFIVYEDTGKQLNILSIWDTRQDPIKLKKIIKKKS